MLQIGNSDLAKSIYESWRTKMDFSQPVTDGGSWNRHGYYATSGKTRPRWELLDSNEQSIWRGVATDLVDELAEAIEMGARNAA